jgi:hypothetical protein
MATDNPGTSCFFMKAAAVASIARNSSGRNPSPGRLGAVGLSSASATALMPAAPAKAWNKN